MFKLQQQYNKIVETTHLTNNSMLKFRCYTECLKCSPPAPNSKINFQSLNLRSLSQPCRSVLVAVCPR